MTQGTKVLDGRTILIVVVMIVLWSGTTAALFFAHSGTGKSADRWSAESQRELANKLRSVGLTNEAIVHYEQYLAMAALPPDSTANTAFLIGTMYMDEQKYEKALAWFYRAEIADPQSSLKNEVSSKIVHCLERLERFSAAQYALDSRSALGSAKESTNDEAVVSGRIVAKIGDDSISVAEIDEALDRLSPWAKQQFDTRAKKTDFLRRFVAEELLLRKAQKLELDEDPEVRKLVDDATKKILVETIIKQELQDNITMEQEDLRNYFLANTMKYQDPQKARVRLIKSGMIETAQKLVEKLEGGEDFSALAEEYSIDEDTAPAGGLVNGWVVDGQDSLGIGYVDTISKTIFSLKKGEMTDVVDVSGTYYIFRMEDYQPARDRPFEEVQQQVASDYYSQKLSKAYQKLIDQVLRAEEVKLYPEALGNEE